MNVQLWNYSKDPLRGVANMELWVDELLVYCGDVRQGSPGVAHTVLFTKDPIIVKANAASVRMGSAPCFTCALVHVCVRV